MAKDKKKALPPVVRVTNADEKKKAISAAIAMIEKTYGAGSIMRLGATQTLDIDTIPTGSLTLDLALGIGGLPRGRIVELYGPESSGKTTVALHVVAEAQKLGGVAAYIDVEHAVDPIYAKALGVDVDEMLISQPDSGEQALEIMEALVRSGAIDVVVLDSVAALTTRAEIEGAMGDAQMGQLARLMSQAMRKLTSVISRTNCVVIFINQIREKIGTMYGNPETTTGGRALKFYSSVRIEVRKVSGADGAIKENGEIIGNRTRCKIVKNKVAPPFKECQFDLIYGKGISRLGELLDAAITLEVIQKKGSFFSYDGKSLAQGRDKTYAILVEKPEFAKEIEEKVVEAMKTHQNDIITSSGEGEDDEPTGIPKTDFSPQSYDDIDDNFEEFNPDL
jgi:recombination protein RecA